MSVPTLIDNHTEQAYDNLLGQFKEKPIIQAVLKTWTDQLQEVENDLYDLMTKTLFLNAEGTNLERYGQLFGIKFPEGLTDSEYRELLIAEIMRRSSDGTPDRIRQILEATTGITNTRIFEHYNANQLPFVMGAHMVYGYADAGVTFDVSMETREARFLKWASPITTGSCILGLHRHGESTLFIPSELTQTNLEILGVTSNKTLNPSFDLNLDDWTYTSPYISYEQTFTDPSHDHHSGVLLVDTLATSDSVTFSQDVITSTEPLDPANYTLSITQEADPTLTSEVTVDTNIWYMDFQDSTYATLPNWDTTAGGKFECRATRRTDSNSFMYILDGSGANRLFLVVYLDKLNFPPQMTVKVDGVEIINADFEMINGIEHYIEVTWPALGRISNIGSRFNAPSNTDYWTGDITDVQMFNFATSEYVLERHYPMQLYGIATPNPTTLEELVSASDGTIENNVPWVQTPIIRTITGTEVLNIELLGVQDITVNIEANPGNATAAVLRFDDIVMYNSELGTDQDELVDQSNDWIGIRQSTSSTAASNSQNAVLPEFNNQIHNFQVETSTSTNTPEEDGVGPIGDNIYGIEDFNVENQLGIEEFNVEFRDTDKPSNNLGIMLEISQVLLTEDVL